MTDKQIIIDRVNVKECKYYCNGKCERYEEFVEADYANYSIKCICEKENDLGTYDICDYQQLKAKEQECDKLKLDLIEAKAHGDYLNNLALSKTLDTVSDELDQLKYKAEFYENYNTAHIDKITKLEKTLAEIKEIATCCIEGDVARIRMKQILQKISEVEKHNK